MPYVGPSSLSFASLGMRPPLLFVSPENDYAAVFACDAHVAVLESQEGRCVRVHPLRRENADDPYREAAAHYARKGYVKQEVPSQDLPSFLRSFMAVAGFTPEHVQRTFELCMR